MKKPKEEKIEMLCVENKRGAVLLKNQYEVISGFIINTLNAHPENEIGLNQLLELAHLKLDAQFHGNVSWFLLQVKQDLEARGMITTTLTRNREQFIRLRDSHNHSMRTKPNRYPAFS